MQTVRDIVGIPIRNPFFVIGVSISLGEFVSDGVIYLNSIPRVLTGYCANMERWYIPVLICMKLGKPVGFFLLLLRVERTIGINESVGKAMDIMF